MKPLFSYSPHIAMQVGNAKKAAEFYERVLGFAPAPSDPNCNSDIALTLGGIHFYLEESAERRTFFEFATPDLAKARETLKENGCTFRDMKTPELGASFMASDPFGFHFHVYQKN